MLAVVAALIAGLAIYGSHHGSDDSSTSVTLPADVPVGPLEPTTEDVIYLLTGSAGGADITYQTPSGSAQQTGIDVPLTMKSTGQQGLTYTFNEGDFLYFSAQNTGSYGSLTCKIEVNGVVVSTNTAHGAYAIATCQG